MAEMLKSPVSDAVMEKISVVGTTLFKDPESGGYWLRLQAMQNLADLQETPLEEVHTGETMRVHQGRFCPEDGSPLQEFEFEEHSGVKVDICETCGGLWLDEGQLTQLLAYLEHYEYSDHLRHGDNLSLGQRAMLFLYSLTSNPPLY